MSTALKAQLMTLAGTFSLIVGIALCGYSAYRFYRHSNDPINHSIGSVIRTFFVGILLISLNNVLKSLYATVGVNSSIGISYTTGTGGSQIVAAQLAALENLAFVIGVGFTIKALMMMHRAETQAQGGAGVITLIVSIFIANPGWFAATIIATFGGK
ncbi:MAG: hypothetical protein ACK5X0_09625 [Rhodospirillales bacterium]|jgi:hypothetical protein